MTTYPTPEPVRLIVRIPSGLIEITTEDSEETTVNVRRLDGRGSGTVGPDEVHVDFRPSRRDGALLVVVAERGHKSWFGRDASYEVQVRTPNGAEVEAVTASADVKGTGRFKSVDVRTASGDVWFDEVSDRANGKSASGDLRFGGVGGPVTVATTSGDAQIGQADGDVSVALVSGNLRLGTAAKSVKARSVSGDLSIHAFDRGRADLATVSGDAQIDVLPQRRVWMDLVSRSGDTVCALDVGERNERSGGEADVEIHARSVSGDIRVGRAVPSSTTAA
jgi:DUF4097 and DUF4098 domain-containing protein YvlB